MLRQAGIVPGHTGGSRKSYPRIRLAIQRSYHLTPVLHINYLLDGRGMFSMEGTAWHRQSMTEHCVVEGRLPAYGCWRAARPWTERHFLTEKEQAHAAAQWQASGKGEGSLVTQSS